MRRSADGTKLLVLGLFLFLLLAALLADNRSHQSAKHPEVKAKADIDQQDQPSCEKRETPPKWAGFLKSVKDRDQPWRALNRRWVLLIT